MFDLTDEFLEDLGDAMEKSGQAVWVHDDIYGNHSDDAKDCWCEAMRIIVMPIEVGEA